MTTATAPRLRLELVPARLPKDRLPVFDMLRGGAALLVFVFHYSGFAMPFTQGVDWVESTEWLAGRLGSVGTNLLLLLSGLFLARSLSNPSFQYGAFLCRRLARIYVPYVLIVLAAAVFGLLLPQYSKLSTSGNPALFLLEQLLLLPGLFPQRPMLTVTWTLSWIVAGYLVLPLFGIAMRRAGWQEAARARGWAAVIIAVFVSALFFGFPTIRSCYIPAGCALHELQARDPRFSSRRGLLRSLGLLAAMSLTFRILLDGDLLGTQWPDLFRRAVFTAAGILGLSSLAGAAFIVQSRYRICSAIRGLRHLANFGRTGYSFYLIHGPVTKLFALTLFPILAVQRAAAHIYWFVMPVCWSLAALAAAFLFRGVEEPLRRWLESPHLVPVTAAPPASPAASKRTPPCRR